MNPALSCVLRERKAGMGQEIQAQILVVGGGMVGLSAAAALAGAGLEVAVVDARPPGHALASGTDGRASAIALGAMRVLEGIGLWRYLEPAAQPIQEIRVSDRDSPLFLHYDHQEAGDGPLGTMVENRHILAGLHELIGRLPSARLVAPAKVADLRRDRARAVATLADGRRIGASLVVAADGRASPIRRAAGIPTTGWSYGQTGIVCTLAHERPHRGIAHERFLPAGPFAMLPLLGNRSSIVWTERAELAPAMLALDDAAFAAEAARRFGPSLGRLEVVGARWSYPLALSHAERYVGARLALVGDAAHAIHPIAGQGFNLGLRGVAALAEVVADACRLGLDPADGAALERYERWRRFDSLTLIAVTDGLNRLFASESVPLALGRDLGLAAVNHLPGLRKLFMRHAMGLVGDLPRLARGEPL